MRVELTGRHVEITPALRRLVDTKLTRLERLLRASALSAQTVLTLEKNRRRVDVTVHARGEKFLHGEGASGSWETSLGQAIDKIAQQALKVKGKWKQRKRRGGRTPAAAPEALEARPAAPEPRARVAVRMPRILRASRQRVRAMSVADATREMEANGDGCIVFHDAETAILSVLYRRQNGELTLIQTEI